MLPAILVLLGDRVWWPWQPRPARAARSSSEPEPAYAAQPALTTCTGTPLSAALPDTSSSSGSVRSLIETPGTSAACAMPDAVALVAVAVGEARPRRASCRRSPRPRPRPTPTREVTRDRGAVGEAAGGEVVGVHQQLVARPALGEPLGVVHPGVAVRWWRRPISSSSSAAGAGDVARAGPGRPARGRARASIRLSVVVQPLGQLAGAQRAEVDARGVRAQLLAA